jgi:hypothetical protein
MTDDVKQRLRAQIAAIEREATEGRAGFPELIARLPEGGPDRKRAIVVFLPPSKVERWEVLTLALADL